MSVWAGSGSSSLLPSARSRISKLGLLERYTEVDQLLRSSPGPLPIEWVHFPILGARS